MTTLLATGLTRAETREGMGQRIKRYAETLITATLLPKKITAYEIERYFRKAHRIGAWRTLPKEAKALLLIARKVIKTTVKAPALHSALLQVFLRIELQTLRGRALLYGAKLYLMNTVPKLRDLLRKVPELLALGIQYLNSPPILRVYG